MRLSGWTITPHRRRLGPVGSGLWPPGSDWRAPDTRGAKGLVARPKQGKTGPKTVDGNHRSGRNPLAPAQNSPGGLSSRLFRSSPITLSVAFSSLSAPSSVGHPLFSFFPPCRSFVLRLFHPDALLRPHHYGCCVVVRPTRRHPTRAHHEKAHRLCLSTRSLPTIEPSTTEEIIART
jgi:hypothetical protein